MYAGASCTATSAFCAAPASSFSPSSAFAKSHRTSAAYGYTRSPSVNSSFASAYCLASSSRLAGSVYDVTTW